MENNLENNIKSIFASFGFLNSLNPCLFFIIKSYSLKSQVNVTGEMTQKLTDHFVFEGDIGPVPRHPYKEDHSCLQPRCQAPLYVWYT